LQARQIYPQESLMEKIIDQHLDLLAKKNYQVLAKELNVSLKKGSGHAD